MKRVLVVLLSLVALGSSLGMVLLYRRYSTSRPVVRFDGGSVTVRDFRDRMELVAGRQILTKMVLRRILIASAAKAGVAPSEKDIDRRIAFIKQRDPQSIGRAESNPTALLIFREDIASDLALEALTAANVKISPAEVQAFYKANARQFARLQQKDTTVAATTNAVDCSKAENLMKERDASGKFRFDGGTLARQPRIEVLGMNSTFNFAQMGRAKYEAFKSTLLAMSSGTVRTFPVATSGPHKFLTVRIEESRSAGTPPLDEIRTEVERAAKIAKAGGNEARMKTLVKIYKSAKTEFEMPQYATYFEDIDKMAKQLESRTGPQVSSSK